MRKLLALAAMATIFLFANGIQAASIETSDTGNASWNYGYGTDINSPLIPATWLSSGGNPGGYISGAANNLFAVWTNVTVPYGNIKWSELNNRYQVLGPDNRHSRALCR